MENVPAEALVALGLCLLLLLDSLLLLDGLLCLISHYCFSSPWPTLYLEPPILSSRCWIPNLKIRSTTQKNSPKRNTATSTTQVVT